jgi:YD repeat-containing protein
MHTAMSTGPFRRRYAYDAAGQLVAVEDDTGRRIEDEYDPNGNRLRRTVTVAAADADTGGLGDAGPSEPA